MAWLPGYTHRMKLTTQFANCDALQTNFPGRVSFLNNANLADALATGHDIRFTQSDGTTLCKYEREKWSGGGGANVTAEFWMKFPSWSAVAGVEHYIYWEKAGAADGEDAANVWDASFVSVHHLTDLLDSKASYDMTAFNTPTSGAMGKVADCYDFDDSQQEYLSNAAYSGPTGAITVEAWAKVDDKNSYRMIVCRDRSVVPKNRCFQLRLESSTGYAGWLLFNSTGTSKHLTGSTNLVGAWHYIAGTYDGSTPRLRVDGVQVDSDSLSGAMASAAKLHISRQFLAGIYYMDGKIDEVRISSVRRSDAWLKLTYYNINEADRELTRGAKETAPVAARRAAIIGGGVGIAL